MPQYIKSIVPTTVDEMPEFLEWELSRIERLQDNPPSYAGVFFEVLTAEPVDLRTGLVVFADGVNFNPTSEGEGLYVRLSTDVWVKL